MSERIYTTGNNGALEQAAEERGKSGLFWATFGVIEAVGSICSKGVSRLMQRSGAALRTPAFARAGVKPCRRSDGAPDGGPAPGGGGYAAALSSFGSRVGSQAASARVNCQSTRAKPRCRVFEKRATVFTQPKSARSVCGGPGSLDTPRSPPSARRYSSAGPRCCGRMRLGAEGFAGPDERRRVVGLALLQREPHRLRPDQMHFRKLWRFPSSPSWNTCSGSSISGSTVSGRR